MRIVWNKQGFLPIGQDEAIYNFFNNFLYKIKIQRSYILLKKLTSHVFKALWEGRAILVKSIPADPQNMGQSIFLIILNIKYKIILGLFFCKKLLWLRIGIVDFSRSAQEPKKKYYFVFQFQAKFQFSDQYLVKWLRQLDKSVFFGPRPRPIKKIGPYFLAQMDPQKIQPNWMQGGRDI